MDILLEAFETHSIEQFVMKKKAVLATAMVGSLLTGAMGLQPVMVATTEQNQTPSQSTQTSQTSQTSTQLQSSYVKVKGDNIFYYSRITNPENKTVVLVHGAGGTADSWRGIIPYLSQNINVIAVSFTGHAQSEGEAKNKIFEVCRIHGFVCKTSEKTRTPKR